MKKLSMYFAMVCVGLMLTGCSTVFVGEPEAKKGHGPNVPPVMHVTNNYYFIVVGKDKMDKGHKGPEEQVKKLEGGPGHREKVPGDPGARRRMQADHRKQRGKTTTPPQMPPIPPQEQIKK